MPFDTRRFSCDQKNEEGLGCQPLEDLTSSVLTRAEGWIPARAVGWVEADPDIRELVARITMVRDAIVNPVNHEDIKSLTNQLRFMLAQFMGVTGMCLALRPDGLTSRLPDNGVAPDNSCHALTEMAARLALRHTPPGTEDGSPITEEGVAVPPPDR